MVYRLIVSYRGTRFAGWQRQENATSVQAILEDAVATLLGERVAIVGASRTDAGVHARGQAAHLEIDRPFPAAGLVHGTNHHLPQDVRVLDAHPMPAGFHARKCATAKEYRYQIVEARVASPLDSPYWTRVEPGLDSAAIGEATRRLIGRHDFSAFALAGGTHRNPVRVLHEAAWLEGERPGQRILRLVGGGFLRGQVRSIVGTLLEVGRGRRDAAGVGRLLAVGSRREEAGPTAPPQGLVLERVLYGERWRPLPSEERGAPGGRR